MSNNVTVQTPHNEPSLDWMQKAIIGAVGGVCLALLKLIDAHFFIKDPISDYAIASYLTYLAYIILGMVVGVFFTDNELPKHKCEKNALVMGLLAPSILIAIVANPINESGPPSRPRDVTDFDAKQTKKSESPTKSPETTKPRSGSIFIPPVHAGEEIKLDGDKAVSGEVVTLREEDIKPPFSISLLRAMGRNVSTRDYTFVVGTTKSEEEAFRVTERLNLALSCKKPDAGSLCARVIEAVQPKGESRLFIMVGDFSSKQEVELYRTKAIKNVLDKARTTNDRPTIESAYNLSEGKILKGEALFSD